MASETELLNSTGLVVMLRDPNTGEVMHLNFPPGTYEIPLEAHLPARVTKVTLYAERLPRGGEYDVRLRFDTNPPTHPTDTREALVSNSRKDAAPPPSAPPVGGPPVTSVIAPTPPEATPVTPLQVEPSTGAPETPQAPSQGAQGGVDAPKAPSPPTEAQKGSPKVTGAGGRRGL